MTAHSDRGSRREFVADVVRLAAAGAITAGLTPNSVEALTEHATPADNWDLSWTDAIAKATDRAVFDWPVPGDPADPQILYFAERYLDNCAAAYGSRNYDARVVLNIRTVAVPIALTDAAWERYSLGAEYNIKDPTTGALAVRN
ncbi:MAG TPA: hypothetical protein VE110_05215, partial [Gemmatimonadaceae bacterium]|nr:hypothetical protein [Gemmatimonadaceae bacterium]